jgi:transcriptional regulator with XRE-family HTH domain
MTGEIARFASTATGEKLLRQERFILEVTEMIVKKMKELGVNRSKLARRMRKSKGRISQLLDGESNITLRTLSDICDALTCTALVKIRSRDGENAPRQS